MSEETSDETQENEGPKTFKKGAEILGIRDLEYADMHVPEWDTHVRVEALTGAERIWWDQQVYGAAKQTITIDPNKKRKGAQESREIDIDLMAPQRLRGRLVVMKALDPETGGRLFPFESEDELEQLAEQVNQKAASAVIPLADKVLELSGLTAAGDDEEEESAAGES